ncbi:MAG TPA: hypothetical protein PLU87_10390 [Sedimentisphaerales bacterium]|nr:hypothetical protein [Sedimentisphaerales bacterium]HRS11531.1 hypothetical protein [Sedimentisphaerales bacterium]HRV48217.1 hypothetical protein [Sedimentisphaerales bacterium]
MSLLTSMLLFLTVGCGEWYLALRRTLACARGEKVVLVSIVFIENLLGLWVLSNFIRTNNWLLALSYSSGAAAGALLVAINSEKATEPKHAPQNPHLATDTSVTEDPSAVPAVRRRMSRRRLSIYAARPPRGQTKPAAKLVPATS